MTTIIKNGNSMYQEICTKFLNNRKLSAKAKGIMAYLLTLPEGYPCTVEKIAQMFSDGKGAISQGLKELEREGYINRKNIRYNGKIEGIEYTIFEDPVNR